MSRFLKISSKNTIFGSKSGQMKKEVIIGFLQEHPNSSKEEIRQGISYTSSDATLKRLLKQYAEEGYIVALGNGRGRTYAVTKNTYTDRKYPDGIQTFEKIIQQNYLYVDKTALLWKLVKCGSANIFLSRPRRFGKSLLISTLKSYFEGRKELFSGLAIEQLEQEWISYPVIRLDLSTANNALDEQQLYLKLGNILSENEDIFGVPHNDTLPGERLYSLVKSVYEKTEKQVVLLIDEYDAPLLSVLYDESRETRYKSIVKELFSPIKKMDPFLRFTFLSGITKFSQLSIFSALNNLRDISLEDEYASLCGFTEDEISKNFKYDIEKLAHARNETSAEVSSLLKQRYDGYHFSPACKDIYNPYSILRVFSSMKISDYWYSSGTPTILMDTLKRFDTDLYEIDGAEVTSSVFNQPTETVTNAVSLFYQSGYLTIKEYNPAFDTYVLSIPNAEVRAGLMDNILPILTHKNQIESQNLAIRFKRALVNDDIDTAIELLKAFFASIPYPEFGKESLNTFTKKEAYFKRLFYIVFSFMNVQIYTEVMNSEGRTDVVMYLGNTIYVIEAKLDGSPEEALRQIHEKGYISRYAVDTRNVVLIGLNFSSKTRTIDSWKMECK